MEKLKPEYIVYTASEFRILDIGWVECINPLKIQARSNSCRSTTPYYGGVEHGHWYTTDIKITEKEWQKLSHDKSTENICNEIGINYYIDKKKKKKSEVTKHYEQIITKYYTVSVTSDDNNEFHELINNSKAVILELQEGEPMYFCYYFSKDEIIHWHRIITSEVKTIKRENICITTLPAINQEILKVYTENSIYTFTYEEQEISYFD